MLICSGYKENMIIGHLIPGGTGIYRYHDIEIEPPEGFKPPTPPVERAAWSGARAESVPGGSGSGIRTGGRSDGQQAKTAPEISGAVLFLMMMRRTYDTIAICGLAVGRLQPVMRGWFSEFTDITQDADWPFGVRAGSRRVGRATTSLAIVADPSVQVIHQQGIIEQQELTH
jgi:hypothetical protein